jgi:hypothetical protein
MHINDAAVAVVLAVGLALAAAARADEPAAPVAGLTLEAAIDRAAHKNERALKAPLRVEAAAGAVDRAPFCPR